MWSSTSGERLHCLQAKEEASSLCLREDMLILAMQESCDLQFWVPSFEP